MKQTYSRKELANLYSGNGNYPPALIRLITNCQEPAKKILNLWDEYTKNNSIHCVHDFWRKYCIKADF